MSNKIYPFKFLDAYTAEDKDIFFGREEEVKQLYNMIYQSDTLLLYGASGTGKTSLIQCGLASQFQQHDWLEVFVRRHKNLNESLQKALLAVGGQGEASTSSQEDLDWLEDIMGNGSSTKSTQQLTTVQQYIKNIYLQHFRPIYLIFDQFEELFILGNKAEQGQFISTIQEILQVEQPVKLIFSIREEYLGSLYEFEKVVPQLLRKKLRIDPMNLEKVKAVVLGATTSPKSIVHINEKEASTIAEQVFEKIRGQENTLTIQLPYLQVFLDKYYRHIAQDKSKVPTTEATFTLAALSELGSIGDILRDFLDEQIVEIAREQGCDHKTIWKILSPFVTVDGTKEPTSIATIQQQLPHVSNSLIEQVVLSLMNNRILRYIEEEELYEVAHDSLALRIAEKRSDDEIALLEVKNLIKSQSLLKNEARELFSEKQLAFIAPFLDRIQLNEVEQQLLEESQAQVLKEQREARRRKILIGLLILFIFAIILGFALYSQKQKVDAVKAQKEAEKAKIEAEQARKESIEDKKKAEEAALEANEARDKANQARSRADQAKEEALLAESRANRQKTRAEKALVNAEQANIEAQEAREIADQKAQEAKEAEKEAKTKEAKALAAEERAKIEADRAKTANAKNEKIISAMDFYQGRLALAYHNGKYGFINKEGEPVIDYEYDKGEPFDAETGFAEMEYAVRNKLGELVSTNQYLVDVDGDRHRLVRMDQVLSNNKSKKASVIKGLALEAFNEDKENLYLDLSYLDVKTSKIIFNLLEEQPGLQSRVSIIKVDLEEEYTFPPILTQLKNLKELTIYSMNLTSLPNSIVELPKLVKLDIESNSSLNTIPENIGNLSRLRELALPWEYSIIPTSLFELTNLEVLNMGETTAKELPRAIGKLKKLRKFTLYAKEITQLPEEFYQLSHLQEIELELDLANLPPSIGQFKKLQKLSLTAPITGLPEEFGELEQLQYLDIYRPDFTTLPAILGQNKQLKEIYVQAEITVLPNEITQLSNLSSLTLIDSDIKQLPEDIGQLESLKSMTIYGSFQKIPTSIAQLKNLEELDFSENSFEVIPEEIGQLTNLKLLYIKGSFTELPSSITNLKKLQTLYLDNTNNVTPIPPLPQFPQLREFYFNIWENKRSAAFKSIYQTLKDYKQQLPNCTFKVYDENYDDVF